MIFSRPCMYGIRALAFLATQCPGKLTKTREISQAEGIPTPFLSKVLLQLRRGHLLRSHKGIDGGYELVLPPGKINLLMIVTCLEGDANFTECILMDHPCLSHGGCTLHDSWLGVREQLVHFLESTTLAEIAELRRSKNHALPQKMASDHVLTTDHQNYS